MPTTPLLGNNNNSGDVGCNTSTSALNGSCDDVITTYELARLVVTSAILGIIILLTVIGNVCVVAAVVVDRRLHNVANYLVASLAITDLMVALLVMPLAALQVVSVNWFLGPLVCDIWISVDVLCCTSSILHLVAIAVDRYWAVTRVDYIRKRSHRRTVAMVATIWIISVSISLPPLFGWKEEAPPGMCMITQDWGYTLYSTIGAFYLPLAVIVIFYVKIFRAARARIRKEPFRTNKRHHRSRGHRPGAASTTDYESVVVDDMPTAVTTASLSTTANGTPSPRHVSAADVIMVATNGVGLGGGGGGNGEDGDFGDDELHQQQRLKLQQLCHRAAASSLRVGVVGGVAGVKGMTLPAQVLHRREKLEQRRERKAARTLAIVTGCFVVCWLPFFIAAVVRPFCGSVCLLPASLDSCISWLGYCNSLANPIIYTVFSIDFRKAFRHILCR